MRHTSSLFVLSVIALTAGCATSGGQQYAAPVPWSPPPYRYEPPSASASEPSQPRASPDVVCVPPAKLVQNGSRKECRAPQSTTTIIWYQSGPFWGCCAPAYGGFYYGSDRRGRKWGIW